MARWLSAAAGRWHAPAGRPSDETFVVAALGVVPAVRVGGVQQGDAGIEGRMNTAIDLTSSRSGSVERRMHPMATGRAVVIWASSG